MSLSKRVLEESASASTMEEIGSIVSLAGLCDAARNEPTEMVAESMTSNTERDG